MPFFENPVVYGGEKPSAADLRAHLLVEPAANVPMLTNLGFTVQEGIKTATTSYALTQPEKVTKKGKDCGDFTVTGSGATMTPRTISVDPMLIALQDCAKRYEGTIMEGALKAGHANDGDLTGTVIEQIVKELLTPVVYKDALRIFFLSDKASVNPDYNQTNGLRKQLVGAVNDNDIDRVAIAANAMATDPNAAVEMLEALYFDAPQELQDIDDADKAIYVDGAIYNNYLKFLRSEKTLESSKVELINGRKELSFQGVPLIKVGMVGQYLRQDFAAESPYLAIYTQPKNLVMATDLVSDMAEIKLWYDINTEYNRTRVKYRLGAGWGFDKLIHVAY